MFSRLSVPRCSQTQERNYVDSMSISDNSWNTHTHTMHTLHKRCPKYFTTYIVQLYPTLLYPIFYFPLLLSLEAEGVGSKVVECRSVVGCVMTCRPTYCHQQKHCRLIWQASHESHQRWNRVLSIMNITYDSDCTVYLRTEWLVSIADMWLTELTREDTTSPPHSLEAWKTEIEIKRF